MEYQEDESAPGLNWRTRADGTRVPYWVAPRAAVEAGFHPKTVNLSGIAPSHIGERCRRLDIECKTFAKASVGPTFDGTLGTLISIYQTHEDSPYRSLKASSVKPYETYARKLVDHMGHVKLATMTGLDIKRWHKGWRAPAEAGGKERLGAATMALSVLKAAVSFGFVSGFANCERLREVMKDLSLPTPDARDHAPEAADIDRARQAAHELGRHRAALCYALQFETTTRQWDLIGQWLPMSDPRPSAIHANGEKWIGPTFASIDENMVLSITPTKTERTTKKSVHVNLSGCQMVMAELARIPIEDRKGPLIINETTGLPYRGPTFTMVWADVREKAGLSPDLWNRDIRAGGITEAEKAGASVDDRAKLAGHSPKVNREVYSRDVQASSDRVVAIRAKFRREAK